MRNRAKKIQKALNLVLRKREHERRVEERSVLKNYTLQDAHSCKGILCFILNLVL